MSLIRSIEEKSRSAARSYYLGDNTVLAVILGELRMVLDSSDRGLVPHLMLDGFWESWVTAWIISNLRRGEVALNIGANCGYYAVMMARQVGSGGKVVAIEPNRTHVENIHHSMHMNGFHGHSTVIQAVASDSEGERGFLMREDGMSMNSAVSDSGNCVVKSVRADSVCPNATFAVIDTEGHEPMVWSGMDEIKKNHGFRAVIEWSPARYSDPRGFYEKILADGFSCTYIGHDGSERAAPESMMMDGVERMVVLRST